MKASHAAIALGFVILIAVGWLVSERTARDPEPDTREKSSATSPADEAPTLQPPEPTAALFNATKEPPRDGKIDVRIRAALDAMEDGVVPTPASTSETPFVRFDTENRIQVYVHVSTADADQLDTLRDLGLVIEITNTRLSVVQGWVPPDQLEDIASLHFVERITPPSYATPNTGSVGTEGDALLKTNALRDLGILGEGVRVGIISDGANHLAASQATGDLPLNVVVQGACSVRAENPALCDPGASCNEGTAIAEIVHDIAPSAELAIAAVDTTLEFVDRAIWLVDNFGADVIVDDLSFFFQPFFEDGFLAQTAADLADEVVFVSAAGNYSGGHYEADYVSRIYLGDDLHDFGASSGGTNDHSMNVHVAAGDFMVVFMQWNDRFGASSNDYDLYLVNPAETDLLCPTCASTEIQDGFEDPIEAICYHNASNDTVNGKIGVNRWDGQSRTVELFAIGGQVDEYNLPEGAVFGHTAVADVLAVATINADEPGTDAIASYSSRGPSRIEYPSLELRPKPDVTAVDGVSVTGAGGFPTTFYGTSAAAPHAAGMAALLKSLGLFDVEVRTALTSGAEDLGSPGWDSAYGYGRIDAVAALATVDADTDGVLDGADNCPAKSNSAQSNFDGDALGDACDPDDDNDSIPDSQDAFPFDPSEWADTDGDGIGNNADPDDDGDGLTDQDETSIHGTNPLKRDTDGDGMGDGEEVSRGMNPLDPNDCPEELCPPPGSLMKLLDVDSQN